MSLRPVLVALGILVATPAWAASDVVYQTLSGPSSVVSGQSFQFTWKVKNNGPDTATGVYVVLRASTDSDYDILGTPDPEICSDTAGTLTSGQSFQHTVTCTWPTGISGNVYVVSRVLYDDVLHDLTPLDGERYYGPLQAVDAGGATPDLVVTSLTATSPVTAGSALDVRYRVENTGSGTAAASTAQVRLSSDLSWDAADPLLCTDAVGGLVANGGSSRAPLSCTVPVGTTPAAYFVLVKADATTAVTESSEGNNVASTSLQVNAPPSSDAPDLAIGALQALPSRHPGDVLSVPYRIDNVGTDGAPASTTLVWLSEDATLGAGDTELCADAVPALAVGSGASRTASCTLPPGLDLGTWTLFVGVDGVRTLAEEDEGNNLASTTLDVVPHGDTDAPDDTARADTDPATDTDTPTPTDDVPTDDADTDAVDTDVRGTETTYIPLGCGCATSSRSGAVIAVAALGLLGSRRRRR